MKVNNIHVVNSFQFADSVFKFDDGINFIVGPNGAGKTNLLNSIMFALDGQLPAKKEDCIRRGAVGDSFVELEFVHNNTLYKVTRYINKPVAKLDADGKHFVGIQEVNDVIDNILGVNASYRRNHIYLAQGGLGSFINCTPAQRAERIWDSLRLEKVFREWVNLGELLSAFRAKCSVDYSEQLNELERLRNQRAAFKYKYEETMLKQEEELYRKLDLYKEQLEKEQKNQQRLLAEAERLSAQLAKISPDPFVPDSELDRLVSQYDNYLQYHENFNRAINLFYRRPSLAAFNRSDADLVDIDSLRLELAALKSKINFLSHALSMSLSDGECLLCGSPIDGKSLSARLNAQINECSKKAEEHEAKILEEEKLRKARDEALALRKQIRTLIQQLKVIRGVLGNVSKYSLEQVEAYKRNKENYEKALPLYDKIKFELASINGQILSSKKAIAQIESNINAINKVIVLSREEIEDGLARIASIRKINERIKILESFEEKHEKQKVMQGRLSVLEKVRNVFSRNSLISLCIDRYLDYINKAMVFLLEAVKANFSASLEKTTDKKGNIILRFAIDYNNGDKFYEDQLSYGEKLMLSLAYHLATNLTTNVDILLLDEPTLGLDEVRVSSITQLLARFIKANNSRLQIICSTHEKGLTFSYYGNVVNLWDHQQVMALNKEEACVTP